ncbi:MAG TPA: hypothetical protein VGL62_11520, partial [Vicinamibacterales bacterium]
PPGRSKTGLIVLAVGCGILLLFAVGIYAPRAFHAVADKAGTPAPAPTKNAARLTDSSVKAAGTQQGAPVAGNAIGGALGAAAKGGSDPGKAPDNATQAGPSIQQHDKASADANGAPDAASAGQATSPVGGLLSALSSAVGGVHRHDPVDFHTLEALLPTSLAGMQDAAPAGNADETMSIKTTSAHVDFAGPSDARLNLSIKDATAISGLAGLANMANSDTSEQGDSYEKTETIDGRSVHEKWDAAARHGELSLSVGERFAVDVVGDHVDMDALKNALAHVDLAKLESMKDANPVTK